MKLFKTFIKIILFYYIFSASYLFAENNDQTIKIPVHKWDSQKVGGKIIGKLFKMVGENVEYIPKDSLEVYESMCNGEIDIVHEIWEGAFAPEFQKFINENCVIEVATHQVKVGEGWWYPSYVKELCPGLPDYKALNNCASLFSSKDSNSKGVFITGPKIWNKQDKLRILALKMNFVVLNMENTNQIWIKLKEAIIKRKPIIIFNWTPNFVEALYEGEFINFPKYDDLCFSDPSWGSNPNLTHDCGNPKDGFIKIGVNENFKKNHKKAYTIATKIKFTNMDIAQMSNYIKSDGMEVDFAAERWLAENEVRWKEWIE